MSKSRLTAFALGAIALGVLTAGVPTAAVAQKPKPAAAPPVTTQGTTKSNPSADKGQATAEAKRTAARVDKVERAEDKADDKVERAADKAEDKVARAAKQAETEAHRAALKRAHTESRTLLKGITLSQKDSKSLAELDERYAHQLQKLQEQDDKAERAARASRGIDARFDALRLQTRSELRGWLTAAQQAQFDRNVAALGIRP